MPREKLGDEVHTVKPHRLDNESPRAFFGNPEPIPAEESALLTSSWKIKDVHGAPLCRYYCSSVGEA
jgi:hypothetical protein